MLESTGARRQESMRTNPAMQEVLNFNATLKGSITNVRFADDSDNKTGQTVVDILLMGGYTELRKVPLTTPKTNADNGEEWTPEIGDIVLVQFINGNYADPVVTGFMPVPDNAIQSLSSEAPRYHRRRNGTDEKIEKDGTRLVYVAADDILEVEGDGNIIAHGNVTVHVYGNANIAVDGNTIVTTPNATVHASQKVQFDTPLTECTGDLQVAGGITSTGSYGSTGGRIRTPGNIESTNGDVKDKIRSMAADRAIYNGHTHPGDSGGTTGTPNQNQ